jgi:hypothetical protein
MRSREWGAKCCNILSIWWWESLHHIPHIAIDTGARHSKAKHIHHWVLQILEHDKWRLLGSITSQGKVEGQGEGGKKLQRRKKVERNKLKRQANEKLMRHRLPKDARRIETLSLRQLGRIKVANYLHLLTWPHLVSLCPLFVNTTWCGYCKEIDVEGGDANWWK